MFAFPLLALEIPTSNSLKLSSNKRMRYLSSKSQEHLLPFENITAENVQAKFTKTIIRLCVAHNQAIREATGDFNGSKTTKSPSLDESTTCE